MHSSTDIRQMLRNGYIIQLLRDGWRIAIAIAAAQLLGAAVLVTIGWPLSIPLMPDAPAWILRAWLGAAFATPVGFMLGVLVQRFSGQPAPPPLVAFCAVAAVVLPLVGISLVNS